MNDVSAVDAAPLTGPELRSLRESAGVTVSALARAYGVARQRIQELERRAEIGLPAARRYLAALEAAGRTTATEETS